MRRQPPDLIDATLDSMLEDRRDEGDTKALARWRELKPFDPQSSIGHRLDHLHLGPPVP